MSDTDLQKAWDEAQAQLSLATKRLYDVQDKILARREELDAETKRKLDAEFGAERTDAVEAEQAATRAFHAARNAVTLANTLASLPFPEGTALVEWEIANRFARPDAMNWKPSGRKGVFQIFKEGDPLPAVNRWNKPDPGRGVIRLCRKDGTLGLNVINHNTDCDYWLPEGRRPKGRA